MITIGDVAEVKGGKRLPKGRLVQDIPTAHRYIRVTDFTSNGVNEKQVKFIDSETQSKIARYTITTDDVYISIAGTIGMVGMIPAALDGANLTENAAKICNISKSYSPKYISYYLKSDLGVHEIKSRIVGTSQPKLALFRIKDIPLPETPIEQQVRVAGILSAYDDLIENNSKRIEKLEAMARLLFRDSHQKAFETPVSQVTSLIGRGISPKYDDNGDSLVINQRCIREQKIDMTVARRQSKQIPDAKLIKDGDVLINSTGVGTLGRVAQVFGEYENTTVDSHVSIVRPGDLVDPYFFGAAMLDKQEEFERLGTGATGQTELGRESIGRVRILLPPLEVQRQIGGKIKLIRNLVNNLQNKNLNLAQARDLLLPRLMSGEIEL